VVIPRPDEPPCFYRYDGDYRGTLGVALDRDFSAPVVRAFVLHEVIPGITCITCSSRTRSIAGRGRPGRRGHLLLPENPVNEGLAVCADMSFGPMLDPMTHLACR